MNNDPLKYMNVRQHLLIYLTIRKKYVSICKIYTIDYFPKRSHIHEQASPSIVVV
jgi:hypothetical protein